MDMLSEGSGYWRARGKGYWFVYSVAKPIVFEFSAVENPDKWEESHSIESMRQALQTPHKEQNGSS